MINIILKLKCGFIIQNLAIWMNIKVFDFAKDSLSELGTEEIIPPEFNYFSTQDYPHLAECTIEF